MDMGKLNVKNGTPVGNEHLCKGCTNGQFTTGYRESDILVVCTNVYPSIRLPFVVHQCSDFQDRLRPDWEQMEKLAIQIQPVRILFGPRSRSTSRLSPKTTRKRTRA